MPHIGSQRSRKYCTKDIYVILVGTKADLVAKSEVSPSDIKIISTEYWLQYIETSAKDDINVELVFDTLVW